LLRVFPGGQGAPNPPLFFAPPQKAPGWLLFFFLGGLVPPPPPPPPCSGVCGGLWCAQNKTKKRKEWGVRNLTVPPPFQKIFLALGGFFFVPPPAHWGGLGKGGPPLQKKNFPPLAPPPWGQKEKKYLFSENRKIKTRNLWAPPFPPPPPFFCPVVPPPPTPPPVGGVFFQKLVFGWVGPGGVWGGPPPRRGGPWNTKIFFFVLGVSCSLRSLFHREVEKKKIVCRGGRKKTKKT